MIATKTGLQWTDGRVFRNASRDRILQEVVDSLRRLRTDYIDIYQVHWPDPLVPIEETAEAMQALGKSGEVTGGAIAIYNIGGLLYGIIGVWLYCALISRYGKGSATAAKAGLVVWALASALPMLMWAPSGILPSRLMTYGVVVDFLAILLGVTMGALLYREEPAPVAAPARA